MEKRDMELIHKYGPSDEVLSHLYKEHLDFEKELEGLKSKSFLTPEEDWRLRDLKKRKLVGRDRMESILRKYRAAEKNG